DSLALGDALDQLLDVEEGEDAVELALRLAQIRGAHGDGEGAAHALEQGWAARPGDPRLRDELVKRYTASGSFRALAEIYVHESELHTAPRAKVESLRRAAELYRVEAGDPGAAAEILASALAIEPENRDVLLALIDAYDAIGEHARAVAAVGRALEASPE